eukprot:CAMPEP_0172577734 /NCGR_PEP_ID=MMETSP1067-20121228/138383_1 /TAXON_ID=265564 ORGANISM="Thalassiosira punctigera, Strain Tpunct2005C2" /NCGR_SAMPLE_ID=MMETSP1067 /ASSEMBLY_ACC=CAM_ASM_000444 /LENGTH=351 /DNA_ID=CAMNT_0013370425 /DNA_START=240 /DNA_END=1294 /DNA_ORIENTATION=-
MSITEAASAEVVRQNKFTGATQTKTQLKRKATIITIGKGSTQHGTAIAGGGARACRPGCAVVLPPANAGPKRGQWTQWCEVATATSDRHSHCRTIYWDSAHPLGVRNQILFVSSPGSIGWAPRHGNHAPRPALHPRKPPPSTCPNVNITKVALVGATATTDCHLPQPLMLVDLGLAYFYLPNTPYNVRVASRHYKSPELLMATLDTTNGMHPLWPPLLKGAIFSTEDNEDQLGKIVSVFGTSEFLGYYRKCDARLTQNMRAAIGSYCSKAVEELSSLSDEGSTTLTSLLDDNMGWQMPWTTFVEDGCPVPFPEALELLDKLLVYDDERRWMAREALNHTFFDDVRESVLGE